MREYSRDELLAMTRTEPSASTAAGLVKEGSVTKDKRVSPYFRIVDFNNLGNREGEWNKPVNGYEIGLKFSF